MQDHDTPATDRPSMPRWLFKHIGPRIQVVYDRSGQTVLYDVPGEDGGRVYDVVGRADTTDDFLDAGAILQNGDLLFVGRRHGDQIILSSATGVEERVHAGEQTAGGPALLRETTPAESGRPLPGWRGTDDNDSGVGLSTAGGLARSPALAVSLACLAGLSWALAGWFCVRSRVALLVAIALLIGTAAGVAVAIRRRRAAEPARIREGD